MYNEEHSWGGAGIALVIGVVLGYLFFGNAKYEGYTAEEWFNEYDYTVSCLQQVEDTASSYYGSSYEDVNFALDEIQSTASNCY